MAIEDILDREQWAKDSCGTIGRDYIDALAAEVRALRKDREMLDWVLENCFVNVSTGTDRMGPEIDDRKDIAAAMASRDRTTE